MTGNHAKITVCVLVLLIISGASPAQDSLNVSKLSETTVCWNECMKVVVEGDYAFAATLLTGLRILDISESSRIVEVGYCDTPGEALSVAVAGNYAYLANDDYGLYIIDISDLTRPFIVGQWEMYNFSANDVAVAGNYAYLAGVSNASLRVIDISDPEHPFQVGSFSPGGSARGVALNEDDLYLVVYNVGLYSIDISDPSDPVGQSLCSTPALGQDVALCGDYAYVGTTNSLSIIDISDPLNIYQVSDTYLGDDAYDNAVSGDFVYIANGWNGVRILNVANPVNPVEIEWDNINEIIYGVAVSAEHCYAAGASLGVIDVRHPAHPYAEGFYRSDTIRDLAMVGDFAYVSCGTYGIRIFDLSEPDAPVQVGYINTPGRAVRLRVVGDLLYVADLYMGVHIIEVSDPEHPFYVGTCDTPGHAFDLKVLGGYIFVADAGYGLRIIDATDPAHPYEIGSYNPVKGSARSVAVEGDYAYLYVIEDFMEYLLTIDISDLSSPSVLTYCETNFDLAMEISGDYLYVASGYGVDVYDVSNPAVILEACSFNTIGNSYDLCLYDNYLYVADGNVAVTVLDIDDPYDPVMTGYYDYDDYSWTYSAAAYGPYALVASDYMFSVFDCSEAVGAVSLVAPVTAPQPDGTKASSMKDGFGVPTACPNPFNASTVLSFELRVASYVDLAVYDIAGRKVASLASGWRDAGRYEVVFDAQDLTTGVYIIRLEAGEQTSLQKLIYLK